MRAAALAGLEIAEPPGQLQVAGWIDRWGAPAIYARPLNIREAARFTALMNVYRRFQNIHSGITAAVAKGRSPGVVLFEWLESGAVQKQDYALINDLIRDGAYKPKG